MNEKEIDETFKKYNDLIYGMEKFFLEFENSNRNNEKEKAAKRKILKRKNTKIYQLLNNHELFKFYLISNYHKGKLTLLDEKQAFDENDSYQKMMDLFLEENETISNISSNKSISGDSNKYLLTQLFTAFSLLTRKVYLNGDKIEPGGPEEKGRDFLKHLNSLKFDKDSKLTNQMLEYFNHNILRIEDIYQTNEDKNIYNEESNKKSKKELFDKKIITEAKEIKKKLAFDKNINLSPFNNFEEMNNVILNNDNKEEAVQQVDSISYEKNFRNIDLENEEYKREKSVNMRKILEIDEEKLKKISNEEYQELISEVYENGELLNKEIEDKMTGGVGNLFSPENSEDKKNIQNSFSIRLGNDIEISMNSNDKIIDDEEVINDDDLDFEQEEIKNERKQNSFFEKGEDFPKEFFQHNSDDEDEK